MKNNNTKQNVDFDVYHKEKGMFLKTAKNQLKISRIEEYMSEKFECSSLLDIYNVWKLYQELIQPELTERIIENEVYSFYKSYIKNNKEIKENDENSEKSLDIFLDDKALNEAIKQYEKYFYSVQKVMPWIEYTQPKIIKTSEGSTLSYIYEKTRELFEILKEKDFSIINGKPGTGKTWSAIEKTKNDKEVQVITLANLVGKNFVARANPKNHAGLTCKYHYISFTKAKYADKTCNETVIFEEASMLDTDQINIVCRKCREAKRIIFCGDKNQLPGFLGFGNIFHSLLETFPEKVENLTVNYRCPLDVQQTMDNIMDYGFFKKTDQKSFVEDTWEKLLKGHEECTIVTLENNKVDKLNYECLWKLSNRKYTLEQTINVLTSFSTDSAIMRAKTDLKLFLANEVVENGFEIPFIANDKITAKEGKTYRTIMENKELCVGTLVGNTWQIRSKADNSHYMEYSNDNNGFYNLLKDFDFNYAMTVHKSQGLEFDYVWYISPEFENYESRNLAYVGYTRSKIRTFVTSNNKRMKELNFKNIFRTFKDLPEKTKVLEAIEI